MPLAAGIALFRKESLWQTATPGLFCYGPVNRGIHCMEVTIHIILSEWRLECDYYKTHRGMITKCGRKETRKLARY